MSRACHRCGRQIGAVERVGRRDACLGCGSDLHCCRNCAFYDVGHHNQCRETQAERQVDKEVGNFCDYFSFAAAGSAPPAPNLARASLDGLFGGRRSVGAGDGRGGDDPSSPTAPSPGADRAAPSKGRR